MVDLRYGLGSLVAVREPPAVVAPLVAERGLQHRASEAVACGLSSVGPGLQSTDLVTPSHVRSSQIRDQSPISYVGRWILYH